VSLRLCRSPVAERVGVDRDGSSTAVAAVMAWLASAYSSRVCLPRRTSHSPCGVGRQGVPRLNQHLTRRRLQRADALADRARRDVQLPGRRVEGAVIGDGDERVKLPWI